MTRPTLGRLVQESTAAIIASRLRKAIRDGELPAGAQLGEAQLARELGVSRGPLREGMQRLTQEGLVISIRNRGLFVVELTADDVRDVYVARSAVERAAAQLVLERDVAAAADQLPDLSAVHPRWLIFVLMRKRGGLAVQEGKPHARSWTPRWRIPDRWVRTMPLCDSRISYFLFLVHAAAVN